MAKFYLVISDPDSTEESLEADVLNFREELSAYPGVSDVDIVTESDVPDGAKGLGAAVMGFLSMEVTLEGMKALIPQLREMAQGRKVEIVRKKADGSEIGVKANVKDLPAVQTFLNGLDD